MAFSKEKQWGDWQEGSASGDPELLSPLYSDGDKQKFDVHTPGEGNEHAPDPLGYTPESRKGKKGK